MSTIDWSKAPGWASAVISSKDGQEFYVSQFGGISARQRVGYCEVDNDHSADMIIPHDWSLVATRRAPWAGEGLPPVGAVCEFQRKGNMFCFKEDLFDGHVVTIIAHYRGVTGDTVAAFTFDDEGGNSRDVESATELYFRPIRTPEQIAAEEREHNVRNACTAISKALSELHESEEPTAVAIIEAMIDAGYSKQVMP